MNTENFWEDEQTRYDARIEYERQQREKEPSKTYRKDRYKNLIETYAKLAEL